MIKPAQNYLLKVLAGIVLPSSLTHVCCFVLQGGDNILQVAFENADSGSHQLSPEQASTFMDWVSTGILGDMADFSPQN